jgi:ribonucleoside-diphosphate reductase subunit M2
VSPTKPSQKSVIKLIDDERREESPDTVDAEGEEDIEELRQKFVGEVDLPESE